MLVVVTLLVGYVLLATHAATPYASLEPETGSVSAPATAVNDVAASGGRALRFGAGVGNNFVQVCGLQLCLNGTSFIVHGATTYGQLDNAANEVALAKQAKLNTLELVEYEQNYHDLNSTMSEATWARVDNFIAVAKQQGLHIILNFSSYGQSLQAAGQKPTTANWQPFLSFVANRTNTKTGIKYKDEPAIARFVLFGEIDAPNYSVPTRGTTAETTAFFSRTLAQWKALDSNHLVSTGGFSYINDPNSGIDWQTIVQDPNNAVCDVEINSYPDRNSSVPNMSTFCKNHGKPWFLAAWSSCFNDKGFADDINNWLSDADMAAHAQDMYNIARNHNPTAPGPATAAAGSDFWNLGSVAANKGSCDIGPQFPQTFATVQANAP